MDKEDLVSYYLKKSQDWIFIPKFRNIKIEDDEILDLDSMDLDNNEDTWLYSSNENSVLKDSRSSMEHEELEKEFFSNEIESKKEKQDITYSPLSPLLGPEDFQHPSFLNSMDELTDSALEDLLRTPLSSRSKSNLLRKALSNSHSRSELSSATVGGSSVSASFPSAAATVAASAAHAIASDDETDVVFKKPAPTSAPTSESVAKSYILHSVENKLFNLADANASPSELVKNRELKNAEIARKADKITPDNVDALCHRLEEVMSSGGDSGDGVNDENVLGTQQPTFKWHSTPHRENASKPPPRRSFPQQPTPILLNRYLKHRHQAAETNNVHLHHEELDGGVECECERNGDVHRSSPPGRENQQLQQNGMNVSYVKYENETCSKLPRIEDVTAQNGLRSTFSKSDDVLNSSCNELNSTYSLVVEDDAASSASESSLSSMSHKLTLSIQEVQKMADMQELSLKKQVYSSYYAGSSKSSEVSSSNESVSTYGALSISNEGSIDTKPAPKITRGIQPPKQRLSYARNPPATCSSRSNSRISTYERTSGNISLQSSKLTGSVGGKSIPAPATNETNTNTLYKNRVAASNGQYSNNSQSPSRKTQSSFMRPSTVPPKLTIPADSANEIVSVKEIKIVNTNKGSSNAGPGSHIPRPASKIPMFRSSSSCNRFNKS